MADDSAAAKRAAELIESATASTPSRCIFPDSWGILRGKRLPASQFAKKSASGLERRERGVHLGSRSASIFTSRSRTPDTRLPDMLAMPDLDDLPAADLARGHGHRDGDDCIEKDRLAGRARPAPPLRTSVERLAALGYTARSRPSSSSTLRRDVAAGRTTSSTATGITKGAELGAVLTDIRRKVEEFGIVVEACNIRVRPVPDRDQPRVRRRRCRWPTTRRCSSRRSRRSRASTACARPSWRSRSRCTRATACTSTSACATARRRNAFDVRDLDDGGPLDVAS